MGVIDKAQSPDESPVFVNAESPYQLPNNVSGKLRVMVRAVDRAGNVQDEVVDVRVPLSFFLFIQNNLVVVLTLLIIMTFLAMILHYLVGHHILAKLRAMRSVFKKTR